MSLKKYFAFYLTNELCKIVIKKIYIKIMFVQRFFWPSTSTSKNNTSQTTIKLIFKGKWLLYIKYLIKIKVKKVTRWFRISKVDVLRQVIVDASPSYTNFPFIKKIFSSAYPFFNYRNQTVTPYYTFNWRSKIYKF